jgi:transposase-like protein
MDKQNNHWLMPLAGMALLHIEAANHNELTIGLETNHAHSICPRCASTKVSGYGRLNIKIRDINFGDYIVFLDVKRRRFRCQVCLSTFNETIPHISEHHRATTRFIEHIGNLALQLSFNAISKQYRLDEKTIRNIFNEVQDHRQDKNTIITPNIALLWIPQLLKRARAILVNPNELTLVSMTEDTKSPALLSSLQKLLVTKTVQQIILPPDPYFIKTLQSFAQTIKPTVNPASLVMDSRDFLRQAHRICAPFVEEPEVANFLHKLHQLTLATSAEESQTWRALTTETPKVISSKLKSLLSCLSYFSPSTFPLFACISDVCDAQLTQLAEAINAQFSRRSYDVIHTVMILDHRLHKYKQTAQAECHLELLHSPDVQKMHYGTQVALLNARLQL